jgi:hypothetical protein
MEWFLNNHKSMAIHPKMANDAINAVPSFQNAKQKTSQQLFAGTTSASVNPKHWKPFGCPVYL